MTKETYNKINHVLGPTWLPNMLWLSNLPVIRHILYLWLPLLAFMVSLSLTFVSGLALKYFGVVTGPILTDENILIQLIECVVLFYTHGEKGFNKWHKKLQNNYNNIRG